MWHWWKMNNQLITEYAPETSRRKYRWLISTIKRSDIKAVGNSFWRQDACDVDGCHLFVTNANVIAEMKNKSNSFSFLKQWRHTHNYTHCLPDHSTQRRKDWTVSEPEVAKPNQIHFGNDNVRKNNALLHFSWNHQNHFTLSSQK